MAGWCRPSSSCQATRSRSRRGRTSHPVSASCRCLVRTNNLAFDGWAESNPSKTGIYLSIANGGGGLIGDLIRLTSNPGAQHDIPLAFSPDGSKLLFVRETPNAERTGDLYVSARVGTCPTRGAARSTTSRVTCGG